MIACVDKVVISMIGVVYEEIERAGVLLFMFSRLDRCAYILRIWNISRVSWSFDLLSISLSLCQKCRNQNV